MPNSKDNEDDHLTDAFHYSVKPNEKYFIAAANLLEHEQNFIAATNLLVRQMLDEQLREMIMKQNEGQEGFFNKTSDDDSECTPMKDVLQATLWECRYAAHVLKMFLENATKVLSQSKSESNLSCLQIDVHTVLHLLKKANKINDRLLGEELEPLMKSPRWERFFNETSEAP